MDIVTSFIPEIKSFKTIRFPDYSKSILDNGIPVFQLVSPEYDVMKMEISFRAGRYFEQQAGISRACANQLTEGTKTHDSEFMADIFDYHGASFQTNGGMDFARIELYTINRYFKKLLPFVREILEEPEFSEKELNNYSQRNKQRLAIDLAKNDILAYRILTESLYGADHPYGYNSDKNTLSKLNTNLLHNHFNSLYRSSLPGIIVAGGIDESMLQLLNDTFGQQTVKLTPKPDHPITVIPQKDRIKIVGKQKFQSSIRLGQRLFSRAHEDYPGIYFLNAVLGGFFGSRLMQNIREDKGMTYDIYSTLDMFWNDGYIMIGAEVANENIEVVISEIYREFTKLQEESISEDELLLVKNYINGNLLNLMNGPFNSIELMRLIAVLGYDLSFFDYFMKSVHEIDAEQLQILAKKYLNPEDFTEVIVGK